LSVNRLSVLGILGILYQSYRVMNIAILSRNPHLYSTQSLLRACRRRGHYVRVVDHVKSELILINGKLHVRYQGELMSHFDAIIPRIGASATRQGEEVLRQFALQGVLSSITTDGLLNSRNKLRSLQLLTKANLPIVNTILPGMTINLDKILQSLHGLPIVVKLIEGTHGEGVMLARTKEELGELLDIHHGYNKKVILQQFIAESQGEDLRAIVVNGEVVASMKRKAQYGEFRSNLHRGGTAIHVKLDAAEERTAIKAANALGLDVAGVDMLQSENGPLLLEVNASPGLEGIEGTTKVDVAGKIVEYLESKYAFTQKILDTTS